MNFKILFVVFQLSLAILYYCFSKPQYQGTVIHGNTKYNDVFIHREKKHGIPHIKGETIIDTCLGQGYVHAQDRLFQMNLKRLFANGSMAQYFGEPLIEIDKMMRQLGLKRLAEETVQELPKDALKCLQAYSDGINLYVKDSNFLPLEFQILKMTGMDFQEWTPVDTIVQGKLLTWMVSIDHVYEFIRTKLAKIVKEEQAREYFGIGGEYQFIDTVILNDEELKQSGIYEKYKKNIDEIDIGDIFKDILLDHKDIQDLSETPGSNSWVIDGKHTYSGKPIVGNDPHLPNNMPTIWYQNEILYKQNGKQKYSIGVSIPGMPSIFIGKTDHFAWGVTILMADISDYYVENIDYNTNTYLVDNQQKSLIIQKEIIKVKGQPDIEFNRYLTHRGPVMSYMFNKNLPNPIQKIPDVSFAWIGGQKDNFHNVLLQLQLANSQQELIDIAHQMPGPGCTVVYATQDNQTGFVGVGKKPLRNNQRQGAFLKDGTQSKFDWIGYSDPKDWPQVQNPKKGYVITANNRFATDNLKHSHSINQFSTSRASRIEEMFEEKLSKNQKFTIQDMFDFQADTVDIYAEKVLQGLIKLYDSIKDKVLDQKQLQQTEKVIGYLRDWNGRVDVNSIGSSVFAVWMYKFQSQIFQFHKDKIAREGFTLSIHMDQFLYRKLKQFGQNPQISDYSEEWCVFGENTNCLQNLFTCLSEVNQFLNEKVGKSDWRQGILHKQQFPHHFFSKTPLKCFFDREFRGFGNHRTVAVAIQKLGAHNFDSAYGSNYRQVVDFAENSKSYWVLDTGISESVFSQYYDDQQKLHERFEYIEMKFGFDRLHEYEFTKVLKSQN